MPTPKEPKRLLILSARSVLAVPAPATGITDYHDPTMPGLVLRVRANGGRSFGLRVRIRGRVRRITLGSASRVSLSAAREKARDLLQSITLGGQDPSRRRGKGALDLDALAGRYIVARSAPEPPDEPLRAGGVTYYEGVRRAMKRHGAPAGPVDGLDPLDLEEWLQRVAKTRAPTALSIHVFLRVVCQWAVHRKRGLIARNVMLEVAAPCKKASRGRILSDQEIVEFWAGTEPNACRNRKVAAALRLELLGATRSTETLQLRRSNLDLLARPVRWTIPAPDRKGHGGKQRAHVVPLSAQALAVIREVDELAGPGRDELLAGTTLERLDHFVLQLQGVKPTAGRKGPAPKATHWTPHDLRRTCATGCAVLGAPPHVISGVLGHSVKAGTTKVTEIYSRYDRLPERASFLSAWGAYVERLVTGKQDGADVLAWTRQGA